MRSSNAGCYRVFLSVDECQQKLFATLPYFTAYFVFEKFQFMKKLHFTFLGLVLAQCLFAQNEVYQTFKDRWVINSPSVETLPQRKLDARISHRFGDFAGDAGGWATLYGLENAADVAFGFEYGITNQLTAGLARSKGAGPMRQLMTGSLKYKLFTQAEGGKPVSLAVLGMTSISTTKRSSDPSSVNYFEVFAHRMVHHVSVLAARKFSNRLSLQLSTGLTHRNAVPTGDENNIIHAGAALRVQVTKTLGLIGDLALPLNGNQSPFKSLKPASANYQTPFGIGFEFDTGGHVFQLNFTNAPGIMPTDYIPYTRSDWAEGQFRIGFTISRIFNL